MAFFWREEVTPTPEVPVRLLRHGAACLEIGARTRLVLQGSDRLRYLNGQVTCDLLKLHPNHAKPACLLTPKGKLCAHVFVWQRGGDLIVETDACLRDEILARLQRYIIADDVTVNPDTTPPPAYHVFGIPSPPGVLQISRLGVPGYDTASPPPDLPLASPEEIECLRIEHGIPHWGKELTADTLPQEARLENSSVDFDKGCYVGQEVVSRLKSVGRVNKRLFGFLGTLNPSDDPRPQLHPPANLHGDAGFLTSSAFHFELAQTVALGYLNRQFENLERFALTDSSGRMLGEIEKRDFPIL